MISFRKLESTLHNDLNGKASLLKYKNVTFPEYVSVHNDFETVGN